MYEFPDMSKIKAFALEKDFLARVRSAFFMIGEGAFDLGISLVLMIMVERSLGTTGLGIYAYLLSVFVFSGFVSDWGISRYLEREMAVAGNTGAREQAVEKAMFVSLATSWVCLALLLIVAVSAATGTRVEEKMAGYILIGITLPLRNLNRIRGAMLQGSGRFDDAARLKIWKRIFLFGAVFLLLATGMPPSYLMAGFFLSELGVRIKSRKMVKLPGLRAVWRRKPPVRATLAESSRFMLTDDVLDVVLHMDFFILGIFLASADLGLYAEAAVLARIFLLIPTSIKPVFRKHYCAWAGQARLATAAVSARVSMALLFFLHSVVALYVLLSFSRFMTFLYRTRGEYMTAFYIFAEILPGLLFFSAVTSQESVYEAEEKVGALQKNVVRVALLNLVLNCFFVPFAGFFGAAFATSLSMFVYFLLFSKPLHPLFRVRTYQYLVAGVAVYLAYTLFRHLELNVALEFCLVPVFVFLVFYVIDFFNFEPDPSVPESGAVSSENGC